nr:outer membrane beta-barrel protein [Chitinophagaceae bacterium]
MWDEEDMNKEIREAADHYQPVHNDAAWAKMEAMLDEHLPQKKRHRKIFYFLPLMVLLCGGILYFVYNNKISPILQVPKTVSDKNKDQNNSTPPVENIPVANAPGKQASADVNLLTTSTTTKELKPAVANKTNASEQHTTSGKEINNDHSKSQKDIPGVSLVNTIAEKKPAAISPGINATISNDPVKTTPILQQQPAKEIIASTTTEKNTTVAKSNDAKTIAKEDHKRNKKFISNFGINLGVGPEVSWVQSNSAGKVTANYGAGIQYAISQKFTLRTGLYISKKIYSVGADDYHATPGTPGNYYFLQTVNANCKVYEVPVLVNYNFGKAGKHNWFASAGLSSYFMKKESYEYFYKTPYGVTDKKSWTITNQNKHYFSVLDLSAGYEYHI